MNLPTLKPVLVPCNENEFPAPSLRTVVQKSALLNLVIILTSFPVLIYAGGTQSSCPDSGNHGRDQRLDLDHHVHPVRVRFACTDLLDAGLVCETA